MTLRLILEHIVGAAPHDHARAFGGHLRDRLELRHEDAVVERHIARNVGLRQVAHAFDQRKQVAGHGFFVLIFEQLFADSAFLRGKRQDFLVVERNPKLFGKRFADIRAAASVLTPDGDNRFPGIHGCHTPRRVAVLVRLYLLYPDYTYRCAEMQITVWKIGIL